MKDHVYKLIELAGTSTTSIEDSVEKASNGRTQPSKPVLIPNDRRD